MSAKVLVRISGSGPAKDGWPGEVHTFARVPQIAERLRLGAEEKLFRVIHVVHVPDAAEDLYEAEVYTGGQFETADEFRRSLQ